MDARPTPADSGPDVAEPLLFDVFVADHGPGLVRLARGVLWDQHQAEDVVQDVLARALLRWDRIARMEAPAAYVRRMVVTSCTSWFRRPSRREHVSDVVPDRSQPDPAGGVDERLEVWALLKRLPSKQRAVLVLRYYEGLPDDEIALVLRCTRSTVRSNAHRGIDALRDRLGGSVGARAFWGEGRGWENSNG